MAPDRVTGYFPARDPYDVCSGCGCYPPYGEQNIAALTQLKLELIRFRATAPRLSTDHLQPATSEAVRALPRAPTDAERVESPPPAIHDERASPPSLAPLSLREAARRLGISRTRTLVPAIEAGMVRTIKIGKQHRIPLDEVTRLARDGLGESAPSTRKSKAQRGRALAFDAEAEATAVLALDR